MLLAGDFDETEGKILLTSLCVTGATLLAFACEPARAQGRLGPIPAAGDLGSVLGFALLIVSVWMSPESDFLPKLAGTFLTAAASAVLVSLLSLASLERRFQWVFTTLAVLTALLAAMGLSAIWGQWESDWFWRAFGVIAVALAAFVVVVPVLHRVSGRELAREPTAVGVSYCPRCGQPLDARAAERGHCPACGAHFSVRFL